MTQLQTHPQASTRRPTWAQLAKAEPELANLLEEAKSVRPDDAPNFCANAVWYGYGPLPGLKPRLLKLVGWGRKDHPILGAMQAYDLAYQHVYKALPDCRGCQCF